MIGPKKILVLVGTRPELIKLAPVIRSLSNESLGVSLTVCTSGQHKDLLVPALDFLNLAVDVQCPSMPEGLTLEQSFSQLLVNISDVLRMCNPDLVVVHGDTSTTLAGSMAAFYQKIPVAHVEAGLRTKNLSSPFPEEMNRQLVARLAALHFAPTDLAGRNLIDEGIPQEKVYVVGNTIVDSVNWVKSLFFSNDTWVASAKTQIRQEIFPLFGEKDFCLVTLHRRENAGKAFQNALSCIKNLSKEFKDFYWVMPSHPNPIISQLSQELRGKSSNVLIVDPISYPLFLFLMSHATFLFSDSGGLQEEAVSLNKQLFTFRQNTERPEALMSGKVRLLDSDPHLLDSVLREAVIGRGKPEARDSESRSLNPFGAGDSGNQITSIILSHLEK